MNVPVGQLIGSDAKRDAVHIAIAPVFASEELQPGTMIKFVTGSQEIVEETFIETEALGIVDPILRRRVLPNQRFYMWLMPNTITSLRHEWVHPAFDKIKESNISHSEETKIVTEIANRIGLSYNEIITAATRYVETGDYFHMGENETYKDLSTYDWINFWSAFRTITGLKCEEDYGFFSCAC